MRRFDSWYRHTILVMLAHANLTVITARERGNHTSHHRTLIALSFNEIRRLFAQLIANTIRPIHHRLHRSGWQLAQSEGR
ncbi:hypothetical protein [Micromonospora sp. NPDC003816]|uniref:hypothetical protein n=1 Tax=Micromonospora sp. NPDC003816 TaxID=3364224 RepID=UPI00369EFE1C